MSCQICQKLLEVDIKFCDALTGTHSQTVPGVPVLLVQILKSVVRLKRLTEILTRIRGLGPTVCPLVRLVDICPQGTGSTLQIKGCQPDVIRVGSSSKIILDDWNPMTHMLALLLIPILRRRRWSEIIHVCSTMGSNQSLPGKYVSRGHLALSCKNLVGQLTDRRLQSQVDLQHCSELHVLGGTPINSFLLEIILCLICGSSVPCFGKLSSIIIGQWSLFSILTYSISSLPASIAIPIAISILTLRAPLILCSRGIHASSPSGYGSWSINWRFRQ
jgi:hypothetical protein